MRARGDTNFDSWRKHLQDATQTVTIDGLNLEKGSSNHFDEEEQGRIFIVVAQYLMVPSLPQDYRI